MADFKKGIVIKGGELSGSIIGVDTFYMGDDGAMGSYGIPYGYVTSWNNVNRSAGQTTQDDVEGYQFFNENFGNMIDISHYFSKSGPVYAETNLADIAIIDDQTGNITGYFSVYIKRENLNNPSYVNLYGKVKNSSGVVLGGFNSAGSIAIQMGSDFAEPKAYLVFSKNVYSDHNIFGLYINFAQWNRWSGHVYHSKAYAGAWIDEDTIQATWGIGGKIDDKTKDKSPSFGPAGEEGGYGPADPGSGSTGGSGGPAPTFDGTSDTWVDTPIKPGVLSFGLLNLYKCDNGALNLLGSTLFPSISKPPAPPQTGVTDWVKWSGEVAEWIGDIIFSLSDSIWNKDLIDYIVSVHLIPVNVTGGDMEDIKVGPRTLTGILARPITEDVIEFDCGTVHIDEYYTNYVDYMTRCRVFLPFYGFVTIKPEYWQSADISLKYLWNVMDGSFIAKLYSTVTRHQVPFTSIIGQYSGCACVHMPLSGANYANMFSQLTGAGAGIAMSAASGNVAVAATSALALSGMNTGGEMQSSNAYNASSAFYGHATPYLIIERPVSHFSTRYVTEQGLPLIMTKRIGDCRGLTVCDNPVLNFACSDEEAKEIKAALKEGVIV